MNKESIEKVKKFLKEKPGYLKKSPEFVYYRVAYEIDPNQYFKVTFSQEIKEIQQKIRKENAQFECYFENVEKQYSKPIKLQYNTKDVSLKPKPRLLFIDIEVSPNLVYSWRIGSKINLSIENIVKERAIICISWKFQGDDKVQTLAWKNGDDKELLQKFAKIMNTADEVIAHNGDAFDIKWIRGRCIFHNIPLNEKFNSIDTMKLAKRQLNLNSNKLTYISKYLGLGEKIGTDYNLWKRVLNNDKKALEEMMIYCENDILLLEQVYNKLEAYSPMKKYRYIKK